MAEEQITRQEHVFVCGGTGSGKSNLTETYLAGSNFPFVIKIDTKGEFYERRAAGEPIWKGLEEGRDFQVVFKLKDLETADKPKIIYVPDFEEQEFEFYNAFFKFCYERENTTIWVDELMSICENPHRIPRYYKAVMTRGRSKSTTCWNCSQRVTEIPNIILSNTQIFFCFQMNLESDRIKLVKMTDQRDFLIKPKKYYFWYYKIGQNKPVLATLKMRS